MWEWVKNALGASGAARPVPTISRSRADGLIHGLPTIERVSDFYDGPDLRSGAARRHWNSVATALAGCPEVSHWHFDALVVCGRYDEALRAVPIPAGKRWSLQCSKILALKLHMGLPAAGSEVVGLFGPRLTGFGRENLEAVTRYVDIQLAAEQQGSSLIEVWARDAHESAHGMSIFNGHMSYLVVKPPRGLAFELSPTAETYCLKLLRDAENAWREERGIPAIGEGWVSETRLYHEVRKAFQDLEVQHHARPDWLRPQHLDIYIPSLSIAIEFQGAQHDQPIAFFGGEQGFFKTQERDKKKQRLCTRHGVHLIHVREGYQLHDVIDRVKAGAKSI